MIKMKGLSTFLFSVFTVALFLLPNESEAATYQHCPDGLCEPALLCPPWTEWNDETRQCRQVASCPGQSQVQIPGGPCLLHCRAGSEPDPFKPHHCRTAFQCPPGRVEVEPNVCEIPCPEGERQNPWRQGVCRKSFECPPGEVEIAESVCECLTCEELNRSHGAPEVNLPFAHSITLANGARLLGRGVTIAVVEAGPLHWVDFRPDGAFAVSHSDLPRMEASGYDWRRPFYNYYHGSPQHAAHGIAVVGVLAAQRNGVGPVGVAPEADYLYHNINGIEHLPHPLLYPLGNYLAYANLFEKGASIFNNSWDAGEPLTAHDFQTRENLRAQGIRERLGYINHDAPLTPENEGVTVWVDDLFGGELRRSAEAPDLPADRPLFVWAAGNYNGRTITANISALAADGATLTVLQSGSVITATALSYVAGLPYYFPDMTLNNIAVAATGTEIAETIDNGVVLRQHRIADFANPCGAGSESFCMVAPGVADYLLAPETEDYGRVAPDLPTGYDAGRGSSLSAPLVSGALALMRQYFAEATNCGEGDECGLGTHELVARVLATADKRGIYANSKIYGAGLLDLKNALTPQGELRFLSGRAVTDSESHPLSQSALQTGAALGDAVQTALRDIRVAAFDEMNAPFPVKAGALVKSEAESNGGSLRAALSAMQLSEPRESKAQWDFENEFGWLAFRGANFSAPLQAETIFGANAYANPYSALARGGMSAGLEWDAFRMEMFGDAPGQDSRTRGMIASFSPMPFKRRAESEGGWRFHFGGVEEANGFLSSSGFGAFADLRSRTAFVGADYVGGNVGGWRIRLGGFVGGTSAENDGGNGWFSEIKSLRSDSFHLGMERGDVFYSGDGLGFRLRQPLRASGLFRLQIPTGRTRYGDLTWREVSGKVSGRELALEGLYRRSFGGGDWRVSAGAVSEPGHRAEAKTIGRMLFTFERKF